MHDAPLPPDRVALRAAALAYLARFAATRQGLLRVLERRIARWRDAAQGAGVTAEQAEAASRAAAQTAREVVERLAEAGAVDDAGFATARAARLHRAGRSRRAIAVHLAARGVDAGTVAETTGEMDELAAALVFARRRRIGPFRSGEPADPAGRLRELAALARAGFPRAVALRAVAMGPDEAEETVRRLGRS